MGIHNYLGELAKQRGQQAQCSQGRSRRVLGKETGSPGLRVPRGQSSQGEGSPAPSCSLPSEWDGGGGMAPSTAGCASPALC